MAKSFDTPHNSADYNSTSSHSSLCQLYNSPTSYRSCWPHHLSKGFIQSHQRRPEPMFIQYEIPNCFIFFIRTLSWSLIYSILHDLVLGRLVLEMVLSHDESTRFSLGSLITMLKRLLLVVFVLPLLCWRWIICRSTNSCVPCIDMI